VPTLKRILRNLILKKLKRKLGIKRNVFSYDCDVIEKYTNELDSNSNTELAIYALEQVHCWGIYFRARTGQFENFTHLNF
jgi:hypothetical protein